MSENRQLLGKIITWTTGRANSKKTWIDALALHRNIPALVLKMAIINQSLPSVVFLPSFVVKDES